MYRQLTLLAAFGFYVVAHADEPSRTWNFTLKERGTYKVQVEHPTDDSLPRGTKVSYSFQIGSETQARDLDLIAGQPYIPLIVDIPASKTMRVSISGLPKASLQHTHVYVFDAASVPPNEYYDPKKSDFKEARQIRAILDQPADTIDLARAKVTFDKMLDPSIDVEGTLQKIDAMVTRIKTMPEYGPSSVAKLTAVQRYIYQAGAWNDYKPYEYDLDDPLGHKLKNKLLSSYIASKKGNCVTMPLLFIILGQRLGVDVTLSTAPRHFLVKVKTDDMGWINLEATSGAKPARDVWYRQLNPSLTDQAISSGIYLQPLTKKESVAAVAAVVADDFYQREQCEKSIALADLVLEYYPKDVGTMILKSSSYACLKDQKYSDHLDPAKLTQTDIAYLQYLRQNNGIWFTKAKTLGWQPETQDEKQQYLQRVDNAKQQH